MPEKRSSESVEFAGVVEERVFGAGSKSEVRCLHLVQDDGSALRLRRRGGHPLHDEVLRELLGKSIHASGRLRNGVLFLMEWQTEKD